MRSVLLALLLLLLGTPEARAQEAGAFARIGFGAQGVGAGNALVADLSGDASPYHNPALAPFATGQHLAASAAFLSFDRRLQYLQFAAPLKPSAGIAAGLTHLSVSDIEGRDDSGYRTEDLSVDEYAFFLAFGTRAGERLSLGVALKFYRADYLEAFDPAVTFGLDLGLTARLTEHLSLGLSAADLLAGYEWESGDGATTTDRFPARLRFGAHYRLLDGKVRVGAEVEAQRTARESLGGGSASARRVFFRVGGAYQVAGPLTLRAGLDRLAGGPGVALRPGAGFTVSQDVGQLPLEASYAFARETKAGGTMHLVTLRLFL